VPTTVLAEVIEFSKTLDIPKSPNLIVPLEVKKIFYVLMSLWRILFS